MCYRYTVRPAFWIILALYVLATHRVTRLVTRDQFPLIAWPRERLVLYWDPSLAERTTLEWWSRRTGGAQPRPHWGGLGRSLAYLVTCDWCVSIYVAAGLVLGGWFVTDGGWFYDSWPLAALVGLASSSATGLIAQREPD